MTNTVVNKGKPIVVGISEEYPTGFGTVQVERAARATADASPEPVVKNGAPTVTGKPTRADRVKHAYTGYGDVT
ncbi:hypothetical protein [Streptomyces sp. NPDC058632]|uniref:hypothetical protein n=1 Tax=unclassified Streptomyces TaxID=2593676 RepID=UPI003647A8E2